MKEGIHPNYKQTTITCACGNVIETGSTKENIRVEVCSKCHPFFTGKQKMVDSGGRVSRFNKKFGLDKQSFWDHFGLVPVTVRALLHIIDWEANVICFKQETRRT